MTTKPLVTVLMTVYNGGKYLESSIRSVLEQSHKDLEFLIINDCSTDDSLSVIGSFNDKRIVVHNNKKNIGQTKSLNVGLRFAKGKYIARMDADDFAFPFWIDTLLDYINQHPEYAAVSSAAVVINGTGKMKKLLKTPGSFSEIVFHSFFGNAINHVGSLLNKDIMLANGGYNEEFKITQDYELWSSLVRNNYRLINIPDALVAVRAHDTSIGFVEESKKGLQEVSETIYRNVSTLTNLRISYEDAVQLRMFYRFPEQLSLDEFNRVHNLYEKVFSNLKDEFRLSHEHLKAKMKSLMLVPYCKRAIFEVENKHLEVVRKIVLSYQGKYGFNVTLSLLLLASYCGIGITRKLLSIYERKQRIEATIANARGR